MINKIKIISEIAALSILDTVNYEEKFKVLSIE